MTLANEDTNSIVTVNVNRAIGPIPSDLSYRVNTLGPGSIVPVAIFRTYVPPPHLLLR